MKPHPGPGSNLALRAATAGVGIPLVLLLDYLGGPAFGVALGAVAAAASVEFYRMVSATGQRPLSPVGVPVSAAMAALPLFVPRPQAAWIGIMVFAVLVAGSFYLFPARSSRGLLGWSLTLVPILYIGLLLGHLGLMRDLRHGALWVLYVLVLTWAYDTGAYAAGSRWGKRPFMQHISPRKTLEGTLGGLALCAAVSLVGMPLLGLAVWQAVPLGLALGLAGQAGDLLESMLKRQTGRKDSGSLMPGHGGLLDRIDSVLFTAAVGYYAARLFGYAP